LRRFPQLKYDAQGGEFDFGAQAGGLLESPLAVSLSDKLFDARFLLADEQVFAAGWDLAVIFELFATVVSFG